MKKLIYLLLLLIAIGCSTNKKVAKKKEKREVVETIDLTTVEESSLLLQEWLYNSILNIEFTPTNSDATFRSDSSGVQAKGMKVNLSLHKDASSTTTKKDTTKTETRTEDRQESTFIKTKDKDVERKLPTWIYIVLIIAAIAAIIIYKVRSHVTD